MTSAAMKDIGVVQARIDKLEEEFKLFRDEVNMKLTIIYEILAMNCDRMGKSKPEQKQHDSETLLESWKSTKTLAQNRLSLKILYDVDGEMEVIEIPENYAPEFPDDCPAVVTESPVGTSKRTKRKRRSSHLSSQFSNEDGKAEPRNHAKKSSQLPRSTIETSKARSDIWGYFDITASADWPRPRGVCKFCKRAISAEAQRLRNHLEKCPKYLEADSPQKSTTPSSELLTPHHQPVFSEDLEAGTSLEPEIKDGRPILSQLQPVEFRELLNVEGDFTEPVVTMDPNREEANNPDFEEIHYVLTTATECNVDSD